MAKQFQGNDLSYMQDICSILLNRFCDILIGMIFYIKAVQLGG